MQSKSQRRVLAYGAGTLITGALVWAGWVHEGEADLGTLIACASTHMELATGVPPTNEVGRAVRARMLEQAEEFVARAEGVDPGEPVVLVARADLCDLRGDVQGALDGYAAALASPRCGAEIAVPLRLKRAELELAAGRPAAAIHEVELARAARLSDFETRCDLVEARARAAAGQRAESKVLADRLAARGAMGESLAAGELLESLGDPAAAERAYRAPSVAPHVADYRVARLKVGQNALDSAYQLLERAMTNARPEIMKLVERDRDRWRVCLEDARFRSLLQADGATPR